MPETATHVIAVINYFPPLHSSLHFVKRAIALLKCHILVLTVIF